MATATKKLTHRATAAAGVTDTITMTGPDSTSGSSDPAWATASATGRGSVNSWRIYNASTDVELRYSYALTAAAAVSPADATTDGVYTVPAGGTDEIAQSMTEVVVKVQATSDCVYSIEVTG